MGSADATTELIELRQTELVGAVYDNRIGVGKIQSRLDNRRANQHLSLVLEKINHDFFQFSWPHLPMRYRHLGLWHQIREFLRQAVDGLDAVVQKKDLPTPLELPQNRVANQVFVIARHIGLNRQPIDRRRFDDAQVADAD